MSSTLFNWSLYGAMVHHLRKRKGIKNIADFSRTIYRFTHCEVNKDVLARIEQGRQVPTATQFMAINLFLFGKIWADDYPEFSACVGSSWRFYNEEKRKVLLDPSRSSWWRGSPERVSDDGRKFVIDIDSRVFPLIYDLDRVVPLERPEIVRASNEFGAYTCELYGCADDGLFVGRILESDEYEEAKPAH